VVFIYIYHSLKWYRNGFNSAIKCDYVTNYIVEVFNNWIKGIKDLPVSELADKVRKNIMVLWHKRKKVGEMLDGRILPVVHKSSAKGKEPQKEKKVHRGPIKCLNYGELGHRQSSYKCPFNGTKKR
jgi:hypothetical protein